METNKLADFISNNGLSEAYLSVVDKYFLPMTESLHEHQVNLGRTIVIGINGAQGSGKSTLADLMVLLLREKFALNCIALSLDDFYHTKQEREQLAATIHPLLITRGVPGTHDVPLAIQTIDGLINYKGSVVIPRFNKTTDDRLPEQQWDIIDKPIDIVLFEGWCLGAEVQTQEQLNIPVNELEKQEDSSGVWRAYVNQRLQSDYISLFSLVDKWIMLKAPSFDCVLRWRSEQEAKLRNKLDEDENQALSNCMTETELARFIQFYQRITEDLIRLFPSKVDYLIELDKERVINKIVCHRKNE